MSTNFELKLYKNPNPYFGYPSLGSNYLPNLLVDERIARFLRNNPNTIDPLQKYLLAIQNFYSEKNIITNSVLLKYNPSNNSFYVYIDDLFSAKDITVTLIAASDLNTGVNVENIQQPTFDYNIRTGILSIYPYDATYASYENLFVLTCNIQGNNSIALSYSFIYNTNT